MISTAEFRDAGAATLRNAGALLEDASLLFRKQKYARAFSLSVVGLEETGTPVATQNRPVMAT